MMRPRFLITCTAALWIATIAVAQDGRTDVLRYAVTLEAAQKPTTNDGVYTKKQADDAKAQFDKLCAECHPFTVAGKKKLKDVPLGEDPFYDNWTGRPLTDMISTIVLTMPNDGSAVVNDEEAANFVAYILQQNGFKAGDTPLTKATATAVVERPKK